MENNYNIKISESSITIRRFNQNNQSNNSGYTVRNVSNNDFVQLVRFKDYILSTDIIVDKYKNIYFLTPNTIFSSIKNTKYTFSTSEVIDIKYNKLREYLNSYENDILDDDFILFSKIMNPEMTGHIYFHFTNDPIMVLPHNVYTNYYNKYISDSKDILLYLYLNDPYGTWLQFEDYDKLINDKK